MSIRDLSSGQSKRFTDLSSVEFRFDYILRERFFSTLFVRVLDHLIQRPVLPNPPPPRVVSDSSSRSS
jgi:hypothetical protein